VEQIEAKKKGGQTEKQNFRLKKKDLGNWGKKALWQTQGSGETKEGTKNKPNDDQGEPWW